MVGVQVGSTNSTAGQGVFSMTSGSTINGIIVGSGVMTVQTMNVVGALTTSGTTNIRQLSGLNWSGPFGTTKTETAGGSGVFAPLGYITVLVSGNGVKIPFFAS